MVKWKHLTESSFELISVKFYNTVYCTNTSQSVATSSTSSNTEASTVDYYYQTGHM